MLDTRDFDHLARAFVHWDHRIEQLGRGPFRSRIAFADFDGVQLLDTRINLAVRTRGARLPDSFTFSPISAANADSTWRGRVLRPGMINVACPHHEMDHRTNPNYRHTAITVRRDILEATASALLGVDAGALLCSDRAPRADESRLKAFRHRCRAALRATSPGDGPGMADIAAPIHPTELVADLVRILASGRIVDPFRCTPADRRRAVREAEEFARSSPGPVTILQLCRLTGVSERTLHYAFAEVTGLSPKSYLKAIRLNRARAELMEAPPGPGRIEAVALRHGFDRPGNFAADFRRLFGILPSQALGARRP